MCPEHARGVIRISVEARVSYVGANGVSQHGTDRAGMPTYTDRGARAVAGAVVALDVILAVVLAAAGDMALERL